MSGTHNKLQHGNNFNHWKFSDLVLDLNNFSFSHPNPHPNTTYLPKHEFPSPNNQVCQRILYAEYYSVLAYMVWSQKCRLTPGGKLNWKGHIVPLATIGGPLANTQKKKL